MSLPQAKKSIDSHPGKGSVTEPTVQAEVEQDVDRKMRIYGIIQAFRKGRMPDNSQIDEALCYARDHSPVDTSKLSPEGRKLIADTRDIIETARLIVKEKNADEVFQNFVFHTSGTQLKEKANARRSEGGEAAGASLDKDAVSKDSHQAVEHLRTIFDLLVTNSEARKLVQDMAIIGRDLFARGASYAADRVRPPAEAVEKVDDAAPSHSWVGKENAQDPLANGAGATQRRTDEVSATTATGSGGRDTTTSSAKAKDSTDDRTTSPVTESDSNATSTKKSIISRFQSVKSKVPERHRETANEEFEKTKQFLKEEFPKERRDQFVWRLKKVVVECQSHSSYQSSIEWLLSIIEKYFAKTRDLSTTEGKRTTSVLSDDPQVQRAIDEFRVLLERFANGQSMDRMINAIKRLSEDAQEDQELRNWWNRVGDFVRRTLLEPGFILSPKFTNTSKALQDQSRAFFDEKYKSHRDELFDAFQAWFTAWGEDRLNRRFGEDWNRLTRDLLFNEKGSLEWKPQLWHDIRTVILPNLARHVGYIPIPRIEYTDKALDLVIENLTLQGKNLFPNIMEINVQNYLKLSPYASIQDESHHTLSLNLTQIHADLRDVAFYFRKKTGLKIRDSGLADVFIGGQGISAKVKIVGTTGAAGERENMGNSIFKVKEVKVKVDQLKFSVRDSKHDLLYKTLRPLATGLIKKQIAKAIGDGIRTALEYADEQLVHVRDRMADEESSNAQVLKELFSKSSSTDHGSETASKEKVGSIREKRESKFKIVPRRDSMLLPDQGHEKGWKNKQDERDDTAEAGEGWKSKAFSIVPGPNTVPAAA